MKDFYELDNKIFVHGWIPVDNSVNKYEYKNNWRDSTQKEWEDTRWTNGIEAHVTASEPNKTIYCGHWHAVYGNMTKLCQNIKHSTALSFLYLEHPELFEKYEDEGIVDLDSCAEITNHINVFKFKLNKK